QVTIKDSGVTSNETQDPQPNAIAKEPPKLLQIVDETGVTGLQGYYLRIPTSATLAFGDLIKALPSFAVVWFANKITWQGTDLKSIAFLFDVTLDRLIGDPTHGELAHGAQALIPQKVQTYNQQIYFYIPEAVRTFLVPKSNTEPVKIEIRHELLDLGKPRSWT